MLLKNGLLKDPRFPPRNASSHPSAVLSLFHISLFTSKQSLSGCGPVHQSPASFSIPAFTHRSCQTGRVSSPVAPPVELWLPHPIVLASSNLWIPMITAIITLACASRTPAPTPGPAVRLLNQFHQWLYQIFIVRDPWWLTSGRLAPDWSGILWLPPPKPPGNHRVTCCQTRTLTRGYII